MTKYIFDFDDVLFFNTTKFKQHMYSCFESIGVPYGTVRNYYKLEKEKGWTLNNLIDSVLRGEGITTVSSTEFVKMVMSPVRLFVNTDLVDRIKKLDPADCYIVTHGVSEYQLEKIRQTNLRPLFNDVFVVQDTKKGPVEMICEQFRNDTIVFVDDKKERLSDLDSQKYQNLRTVLYTGPESIEEIFRLK